MRLPTVADLERRLPSPESFSGRVRGPAVTSRVGTWLGVALTVTFLTGLWSHWQYEAPGWLTVPTSPASLYRWTQGLHVVSGTAAVPLVLVKLWSVFPRFFERPPLAVRRLVPHLLERLSIFLLVGSALFQLFTGIANSAHWYPWAFSFRDTHYAVAWVFVGALALHVAVKLPVIRRGWAEPVAPDPDVDAAPAEPGPTRRAVLRTTYAASGLAVLLTAGQTVPWLRRVSVFGVRDGEGPQGLPVNRSAVAAGVDPALTGDGWRLTVTGPRGETAYSRADLEAMEQVTQSLPIACVEGWSAGATWTGVRVRDLVRAAGGSSGSWVGLTSLQTAGSFGTSELPSQFADDDRTLLALQVNGEDLDLDHGYPCRLIAPNRPGVLQTKWVTTMDVL